MLKIRNKNNGNFFLTSTELKEQSVKKPSAKIKFVLSFILLLSRTSQTHTYTHVGADAI